MVALHTVQVASAQGHHGCFLPSLLLFWRLQVMADCICRSTELRLACSPDKQAHMIVREPAQCVYIITLYLPKLCQAAGSTASVIHTERNEL